MIPSAMNAALEVGADTSDDRCWCREVYRSARGRGLDRWTARQIVVARAAFICAETVRFSF